MKDIPDPKKCLEVLKEVGCSPEVINHCEAVRDLAVRIAQRTHADVELVEAGALLHDIGRSKTHGMHHGLEGVKLARELGLPQQIVLIIERHIGAGIPKEEATSLGLPSKDYLPLSLEEKIIAHADNLIAGVERQPLEKVIEKALQKGQKSHAERLKKLHQELSDICGINIDEI